MSTITTDIMLNYFVQIFSRVLETIRTAGKIGTKEVKIKKCTCERNSQPSKIPSITPPRKMVRCERHIAKKYCKA